jgi:peptidyl-tRNA hydrolase
MQEYISIKLIQPTTTKLMLVKLIKDCSGLGLKDSKDICDELHSYPGRPVKMQVLPVAIDGTNYLRKFTNELKNISGQFEVNGGTQWQRNYKMLSIGIGDKSEYVDFISEYIFDNRTLEESKDLIKFIIEKLSEKEIEEVFSKIKIDI